MPRAKISPDYKIGSFFLVGAVFRASVPLPPFVCVGQGIRDSLLTNNYYDCHIYIKKS